MSNIYIAKEVIIDCILNSICDNDDIFIVYDEIKNKLKKDSNFNLAQDHIYNATNKRDLSLETIFWENDILRKEEIETRANILKEQCLYHD
jgi:hypothetical protein